ncbi:MAG: GreA/GreB family elongation factor [Solirubrobacterales bacterium]
MAVQDDGQLTLTLRLTRRGADMLRAELAELIDIGRPAAQGRLHAAYESGNGDGGAETSDAAWALDRLERRIARLEAQLRTAQIVDADDLEDDVIAVGHRVDVRRAGGLERCYVLVSPVESDPRTGRISIDSPLGGALLGRRAGDVLVLPHNDEAIEITAVGAAP